jgi:hypothetical protein
MRKTSKLLTLRLTTLVFGALLSAACAPAARNTDPLASLRQADGSVVWQQEYRFALPPAPWQLITLDEDDYSVAFMKGCNIGFPCQSTLAYAEEPFGYSPDFMIRQAEFFRRFLWASRVNFEPPRLRAISVFGKEGMEAVTVGIEPVLRHKVWCKIIFARRGERIVAFYFTQWRPEGGEFNRTDETEFDRFVESFQFLKPSFYERLLAPQ